MGVDLTVVRTAGVLFPLRGLPGDRHKFVMDLENRLDDEKVLFFSQASYDYADAFGLLALPDDVETILDRRIGGTPWEFTMGSSYPETAVVKGGARDPFVVVIKHGVELSWKVEDLVPKSEAFDWITEHGQAVECLFSFFN